MLQDIYYSRKSKKAVQVISQCRILPDGTDAVCFQELSDNFEVFVLRKEHFTKIFERKGTQGGSEEIGMDRRTGESIEQKKNFYEESEDDSTEEEVPGIIRFLDAETYEEKMKVLEELKDQLDNHMLNNMAVSLDLSIEDGVDGYSFLMSELKIRNRFEGKRGGR